ncbi:MAG: hypothetical protein CM1200mP3_09000 [Chloroflexota bacterium]|nr:MAG: hypothetical protein CM1200mP3_09000 [Chloroflexota bacterium]
MPTDFDSRIGILLDDLKRGVDECDQLLSGNEIFLARTKNVGILDAADAVDYGVSGPTLRASGVQKMLGLQIHILFMIGLILAYLLELKGIVGIDIIFELKRCGIH